jgi:bacillithiol system protein YtxJ
VPQASSLPVEVLKMAAIETLSSVQDWNILWEAQKAEDAGGLLVFKRSPICPTSHFVEANFNRFVNALPQSKDLKIVSVDVVNARPVSQRIAADTKIRHESPQALLISRGQNIIWNASHGDVDEAALTQALAAAKV